MFVAQCHLNQHHQNHVVFFLLFLLFGVLFPFPSSIWYRFSYRFATQYIISFVRVVTRCVFFFLFILHLQDVDWKMLKHSMTIGQRIKLIWHWLLRCVHYQSFRCWTILCFIVLVPFGPFRFLLISILLHLSTQSFISWWKTGVFSFECTIWFGDLIVTWIVWQMVCIVKKKTGVSVSC